MELGIGFDDLNDVAALVDPERKAETSEVLLRHGTKEDVLEEESKFVFIFTSIWRWLLHTRVILVEYTQAT